MKTHRVQARASRARQRSHPSACAQGIRQYRRRGRHPCGAEGFISARLKSPTRPPISVVAAATTRRRSSPPPSMPRHGNLDRRERVHDSGSACQYSTAYTIPSLSYVEAMGVCNFGAKVVYPPTIYPVCVKNIPILVKNTFNPSDPGTVISAKPREDRKPIKGISSISGTSLITVTGLSMVGVIGVNRRIYSPWPTTAFRCSSVSRASSENSTSIGVRDQDAAEAIAVLDREFAKEIEEGAMFPMHVESSRANCRHRGREHEAFAGYRRQALRHARAQRHQCHSLLTTLRAYHTPSLVSLQHQNYILLKKFFNIFLSI